MATQLSPNRYALDGFCDDDESDDGDPNNMVAWYEGNGAAYAPRALVCDECGHVIPRGYAAHEWIGADGVRYVVHENPEDCRYA